MNCLFEIWEKLKELIRVNYHWSKISKCNVVKLASRSLRTESLEARRLLSINAPFLNAQVATLVITGSAESNTVIVSELGTGAIQVEHSTPSGELTTIFDKSQISAISFVGNAANDIFYNRTSLNTYALGGKGDDILHSGSGRAVLWGQEGNDQLYSVGGDDWLYGGDGDDQLRAGDGADLVYGGYGNDLIEGDAGNDTIYGEAGNDTMIGGDGDDRLEGGDGNDLLDGGLGDDTLLGEVGSDTLIGGADNDVLLGGDGQDSLSGLGGRDYLHGGFDQDRLDGGEGNDTLEGAPGNDELLGGAGNDLLRGGAGNDQLYGESGNDMLLGDRGDDWLFGAAGIDRLEGGDGNDHLDGGTEDDALLGEAGSDTLIGGAGDDVLLGGDGQDSLAGLDGNDYLHGGLDQDNLQGGEGNDTLVGAIGDDALTGGPGNDTLEGAAGNDVLLGGAGDDLMRGGQGHDQLSGESGNDTLLGDDGDDWLFGAAGSDRLEGGDGSDWLDGGADEDALLGDAGSDTLIGGAGDDVLLGGDGQDSLAGLDGNDYLHGGLDQDNLQGGEGNDTLVGAIGDDALTGGPGNDTLEGAAGNDVLLGGAGDDLMRGGQGHDQLSGESGNDTLLGDDGDDWLFGAAGSDRLEGGDGSDWLDGGADEDALLGDAGSDTLIGGAGDDLLLGGADQDSLLGFDGNDYLHGGTENDLLSGGSGNDTLVGATGDDALSGGPGADKLFGESGDDLLRGNDDADLLDGGDGDDVLIGGADSDELSGGIGNDALVGDEGTDYLRAGAGNDLVIGGRDADLLFGEEGQDILVGAETIYDNNPETLRQILSVWSNGASYESRVEELELPDTSISLLIQASVIDDYDPDTVYGGANRDWLILSSVLATYNPLGADPTENTHSDTNLGGHAGHHQSSGLTLADSIPAKEGFDFIDSVDRLVDRQAYEIVQASIPHADSVSKRAEHLRLFDLVKYADITHQATASGNWSDPSIWANGIIPTANARVLIPLGAHVTVDGVFANEILSIRVDGTLRFATDVDSELRVDTVVVTGSGKFNMGTTSQPIQSHVTAKLVFTDHGEIDRDWDPFAMSRGLITHGAVEMHGAETTTFTTTHQTLPAGTSTLFLSQVPTGWNVGDELVIAGTNSVGKQDEVRKILSIIGNRVTVAPLRFTHRPAEAGLDLHIANLSRNVVVESQATQDSRRGHIMFMHNRDVHVRYAGFYGLGRTDKFKPIDDPVVDSDWKLRNGTGTNSRARYAVHFHRNGVTADSHPATIEGSVVTNSPGWGYVNHSSYVNVSNNVAFDVRGSAFATEEGDEIGSFIGNIAIHTTGVDEPVDARELLQDFGQTGDGFWLQGAGVSVNNNVAIGSTGSGFIYYTRGFKKNGNATPFLSENLVDRTLANGDDTILVDHVPIKEFSNNTSYASNIGLTIRYHLRNATHDTPSLFTSSKFWNNKTGIHLPYSRNLVLEDLLVLNDGTQLGHTGIDQNAITKSVVYNNLRVEGYQTGIDAPWGGSSLIVGGKFDNFNNIVIGPPASANRELKITGDPLFTNVTVAESERHLSKNIKMTFSDFAYHDGSISHLFYKNTILLDFGPYSNRQLFFGPQQANGVPFPIAKPYLPDDFIGKTNGELFSEFGLAIAGQVAPQGTTIVGDIIGLLAPVPFRRPISL